MTLFILLLIFLLFISGLFSASEMSLFSLSSMRAKSFAQSKRHREHLAGQLLEHPRELMVTILMVNVLVNILVQNVVSNLFGDHSSWIMSVGVPLALTLIFGEVIPKTVGLAHNVRLAKTISPMLTRVKLVLGPLRRFLTRFGSLLAKSLSFFLSEAPSISVRELEHALENVMASGAIDEDEAQLVQGYLNLEESTVRDHLRPRDEILFHNLGQPLSHLANLHVDEHVTRVPICDGGLENVVGVMSAERFFHARDALAEDPACLAEYMSEPMFVPETMDARDLLNQFRERREELAIVVDEHRSVTGIVTQEDLIEVLVGEIADTRDPHELYKMSGEDVMVASGKLELAKVSEVFGRRLKSDRVVTLGGYLIERHGDIPHSGEKIHVDGFTFTILEATEKQVKKIHVLRHWGKR